MAFRANSTGIDPNERGGNVVMPKGWYGLKVVEFVTKNGKRYPEETKTKEKKLPMINVVCEVVTPIQFSGERVFHSVTFIPQGEKGAGMWVHWLKTIGQPWDGDVAIDSNAWVGAEFMGYLVQDEYKGKTKNKISEIKPLEEAKEDSGIPF